jgi:hypothetical protein
MHDSGCIVTCVFLLAFLVTASTYDASETLDCSAVKSQYKLYVKVGCW